MMFTRRGSGGGSGRGNNRRGRSKKGNGRRRRGKGRREKVGRKRGGRRRRSRGNREWMYEGSAMMKMMEYEARKNRGRLLFAIWKSLSPCGALDRNRLRSRECLNDDFSRGQATLGVLIEEKTSVVIIQEKQKPSSGQGGHISIWQQGLE